MQVEWTGRTFFFSKMLSGESLELDAELDKERIVVDHSLEVIHLVGILDVIAAIMDSTRTNVTTGSLQLMCTLFHLEPILLIESFCYLSNAGRQRHYFKSL